MSIVRLKTVEQKRAEASVEWFRKQLGPFVVAAETTRMPMVFTDAAEPDFPIIFANDSFLRLTGYARTEVLGHGFAFLLAQGASASAMLELETAFDGGCDICPNVHYKRANGTEFWASLFISPVHDEHGQVVQYFVSLVDLTKQNREAARCNMLIDELNHRVKNTLATVQSIVSQALRRSSDKQIVEAIESRLLALSHSHDLLTTEKWESVGLHDLVLKALEPFKVMDGRSVRFDVSGENVRLTPKVSLALSIAFHELATNAVKYGALSNATGQVAIDWQVVVKPEGRRLVMRWEESQGPPVVAPDRKGFGSRVLERGLTHELGGTVELSFGSEGVICSIDFPFPQDLA